MSARSDTHNLNLFPGDTGRHHIELVEDHKVGVVLVNIDKLVAICKVTVVGKISDPNIHESGSTIISYTAG